MKKRQRRNLTVVKIFLILHQVSMEYIYAMEKWSALSILI